MRATPKVNQPTGISSNYIMSQLISHHYTILMGFLPKILQSHLKQFFFQIIGETITLVHIDQS